MSRRQGDKKMRDYCGEVMFKALGYIIAAFVVLLAFSVSGQEWHTTEGGLLEYSQFTPEYQLIPHNDTNDSILFQVKFKSRNAQIEGLLRKPKVSQENHFPGIVLLPGATVTKEGEQGLAKYLCSLGYASITLDQRNFGGIDLKGDMIKFLKGEEPIEHLKVHDALLAAEILRNQPDIDSNRIIYVGESNGGRSAIIACALDPKARGVIAISACGYGIESANAKEFNDTDTIRFYRSIDPDMYLSKIPPRRFVMFHSIKDTVIPYEYAATTYEKAFEPKSIHLVECTKHGFCIEMNASLEEELMQMVS